MRNAELSALKKIFEGYGSNNLELFKEGSLLKYGLRNEPGPNLTGIATSEGAAVMATALARVKQQINTILLP